MAAGLRFEVSQASSASSGSSFHRKGKMSEQTAELTRTDLYDYRKFAILYVDDEEKSLKSFARAFGDQFAILTATDVQSAWKLLNERKEEIGILMTDQRMPGQQGVWLLEKARQLRPSMLRILVTAFSDMDAAIAAVNSGAIYKYIT